MQRIRFRRSDPAQEEQLLLRLYEYDVLGIIEHDDELQAFFPDRFELAVNLADQQSALLAVEKVEEGSGAFVVPQSGSGFCVGERFYVGPSVLEEPLPPGRLHLRVDATQAFGTGRHESTQLMLQLLEMELRPFQFVIDVGSGSGILSQAVRLLGAQKVVSCDIDEVAVSQTRAVSNASSFVGSVDAIQSNSVDLLLVNISARVIDDLAAQLKRVLKPNGVVVASGFIREGVPQRLVPRAITERDGWQCWVCGREDIIVAAADGERVLRHAPDWW